MALRLYRRFRASSFRLSIGKWSQSTSIGRRGSWLAARAIVSLPGGGLSWTEQGRLPPSAIAAPNLQRDGLLIRLIWTISVLAFAGLAIILAATVS